MTRHTTSVFLRFGWCLLALLVAVAGATGAARALPPHSVYVSVAGVDGHPLTSLTVQDFVVSVDGRDQAVLNVRPATDSLSLVLVVDQLYVADQSLLQVRKALQEVVESVRQQNRTARIGLSSQTSPPKLVSVTEEAHALDRTVSGFFPSPDAAPLLEGIIDATGVLAKESTNRRVVLAITSHRAIDFSVGAQRISDALRHTRSALWAVELWPTAGGRETRDEAAVLDVVTGLSGGQHATIYDATALPKTTQQMVDLLLSQYVVTYAPPPPSGSGALRVGVKRDRVEVIAPRWD